MVKIYLPLSKPSLATVSLFVIVNHWNAWFDGLIYMNLPEKYPKAWAENSWHLGPTIFRLLMVLATICGLILTIFSLSTTSLPSIIGNLVMTVFVFAFGYFRYKSGKVHLSARELYKE